MKRFSFATAPTSSICRVEIFGADTNGAGFSASEIGQSFRSRQLRTPDFLRGVSHLSPACPTGLLLEKPMDLTSIIELQGRLFDSGNLEMADKSAEVQVFQVSTKINEIYKLKRKPICIGGDHLVKHGVLSAVSGSIESPVILYVDAHPDSVISEAINFETVIHHCLKSYNYKSEQIKFVGLRQINKREAEGLSRWKLDSTGGESFEVQSIAEIFEKLKIKNRKVFISIDLDGLNPTSAPGVEAPYPGGPTLFQLLALLRLINNSNEICGLEISEFIPELDPQNVTAQTALRLIREIALCL